MANIENTVNDLVDQVRSQLDEDNSSTISTKKDILPALNRGLDYAANTLAKLYEDPLVARVELTLDPSRREYDIPDDCLEGRIEKIELRQGTNVFFEIKRASYRELSTIELATDTSTNPNYYSIMGNKIRFTPGTAGGFRARIWYLKCPEKLVLSQGMITTVNEDNNYIIVDQLGSDLNTQADSLSSYVNLVDGSTGIVKGSFQIKRIDSNKITLKTIPARTTVLGKSISNDLSGLTNDLGDKITVEPDDYICSVSGACVGSLGKIVSNFLIQYAVSELTRKLQGQMDFEFSVLKDFERKVKSAWAGRETTLRVKRKSRRWGRSARPFIYNRTTSE